MSATGEAGVLEGPTVEIRGKTVHDQKWIDETTEAGVRGLGWKRPGPRPPEWDRPLAPAVAAIDKAIAKPAMLPVPKPRPRWLQMLRSKAVTS